MPHSQDINIDKRVEQISGGGAAREWWSSRRNILEGSVEDKCGKIEERHE